MMRRFRASLLLISVLGMVGFAAPAHADSENYGDYSLMFSRHAGQYTPDGTTHYQWAWSPQSATETWIGWGDPNNWPPPTDERYVLDGDWVLITGYGDGHGGVNVQKVTSEYIGDANCQQMTPIPSDNGYQHYVRWTIPSTAYCLQATGTITVAANGAVVHFQHNQIWYPPAPCANRYYAGQTCVRQHEQWSDDNGHPFQRTLERDQYIARGMGMAFHIDQTYGLDWPPGMTDWQADMNANWPW